MILAEILRRAKNDVNWSAIGPATVFAALGIQITAPLIAISLQHDDYLGRMYEPAIPIPIPAILAIIRLIMIQWKNLDQEVS
ncbi:MAG: hypothetical protein ACXABV_04285 [Candidatus Thorarchaeota archaeon]|jgi:hypothetical protein